MSSLVNDLQRDALNQSITVVELLHKSLVVASKLKQDDFRAWIQLELDGYRDKEVPAYRVVHGFPKVFNPYRGYQPLVFQDANTAERYSRMHFNQPIGEIEHSLNPTDKKGSGSFAVSYTATIEQNLMKAIEFNLQPSLHISASQFQKVLDAVRKIILEWGLKLEEGGVVGEGLGFSVEEKEKAGRITYNVRNYIHGTFDKSQIQIESEHSSQTQQFTKLDPAKVAEFVVELRSRQKELRLEVDERDELESELKTIEAQVNSPKPKDSILRESLESVRRVLEGATGNLIASGLLNHLGRLFGV